MHSHDHDQPSLYEGAPPGLRRDYGHLHAQELDDSLPFGRAGLAAVLLLVLLSLAASAPILLSPTDLHLPRCSEPYDAAIYPWNFFWAAECWGAEDGSPLFTRRVYWPDGESLALYTPTYVYGLLSIPLQWVFGPGGLNIAVAAALCLSTLATALLAYRLGRALGLRESGAFVAALLFAFAAGRFMNAARLNLFCTEFLLLYLLSLHGFLCRGGFARAGVLAITSSALLLQSQPLFFQAAIATLVLLLLLGIAAGVKRLFWRKAPHWTIHRPDHATPPRWAHLAAAVLGFALLSGVFLAEMNSALQGGGPALDTWKNVIDRAESSLDLASLVVPTAEDRLWGGLPSGWLRPLNPLFEGQATGNSTSLFLGLPWLLAIAYALLRTPPREWLLIGLASVAILGVALGPQVRWMGQEIALPSAYSLLSWLPPVQLGKSPLRLVLLVQLGLALVAGVGAQRMLRPRPEQDRPSALRRGLFAVLVVFALTEASETLPLRSIGPARSVPEVVVQMAEEEQDFAVLDLPYEAHRVTATAMALGAFHRRPIFFGLFPRASRDHSSRLQERVLFQDLDLLEDWVLERDLVRLELESPMTATETTELRRRLEALPQVRRVDVNEPADEVRCWLRRTVSPGEVAQAGTILPTLLGETCTIRLTELLRERDPSPPPTTPSDDAAVRADLRELEVGCVTIHDLHDDPPHRRELAALLREYFRALNPGREVETELGEGYDLQLFRFEL